MAPSWLMTLRQIISYTPIGLYAESLRFSCSIVSVLGAKAARPVSLTGCVKDLGRIWYLTPAKLLSNFSVESPPWVASVRHGNAFPLANHVIFDQALITRRHLVPATSEEHPRQTTVNISFILPAERRSAGNSWITHHIPQTILTMLELGVLMCLSALCVSYGLTLGSMLLICQTLCILFQALLQHTIRVSLANKEALEKDVRLGACHGAAIDAHVLVDNWNASNIDVLIGYSSQLHAMTNIPVRVEPWKRVVFLCRMLILVLTAQEALLASLFGKDTHEAWGSAIWLASYAATHLIAGVSGYMYKQSRFGDQDINMLQVSPIPFAGRRPALAFIGTLEVVNRRHGVGKWDWMDTFMPDNARRKEWTNELCIDDSEAAVDRNERWNRVSVDCRRVLSEVSLARRNTSFTAYNKQFAEAVKTTDSNASL